MTQREPIQCADCGAALDLSPKAVGMGAGVWAVNCTECHRTAPKSFLGYGATAEGWSELESIRADFVRSRRFDETDRRVREVALVFDRFVDAIPCACGGRFSLSAKPRCPRCGHVAFDTYFHVVNERLSKERLKRLNQLFGRG